MPIDPINGSSHSSMLDLWAQKIRANKEAKEAASTADPADPSASVRVNGGKVAASPKPNPPRPNPRTNTRVP